MCGLHPDPYTLGELIVMLEEYERSEWGRTSSLMALIASAFGSRGKTYKPDDFNPFTVDQVEGTVNAKDLGQLFGFTKKGAQG